jgi:beta-lactamase regulating signal transducer with metallopeptidase domain/ketosteroid isomerase-like protein
MTAEQVSLVWRWLVVEGAMKGSALVLIAAAAAIALRRSSAALRHLAWTAGLVGLLVVAPLARVSPAWRVRVPPAMAPAERFLGLAEPAFEARPADSAGAAAAAPGAFATTSAGRFPTPVARPSSRPGRAVPRGAERDGAVRLQSTLLALWALGALVLGAWFVGGAARLSRLARAGVAVDDARIAELAESAARQLHTPRSRFRLRWTERALTPMTWGFRRPFVLLPAACAGWEEERLRQALVHEIAHVKRGDVFTQALGTAACVIYWFNPLAWWAARRMLVERESACDDLVLASGAKPSTYAHELLEIARSLGAGWALSRVSPAMARRSQISGRLLAILDPLRRRQPVRRPAVAVAVLASLGLILPAASISFVRAPGAVAALAVDTAPGPIVPAEPRSEIDQARAGWRGALRGRDAARMAGFYTSDARIVDSMGFPVSGRSAVAASLQRVIDSGVTDITVESLELHPVGEMFCQVGRASIWRDSGGAQAGLRFMTLWKREEGRWRIHRELSTQ